MFKENAWVSQPAFIIGGGVSITGINPGVYAPYNTIGVNWAWKWFRCDLTVAADGPFWRWIARKHTDAAPLAASTIDRYPYAGERIGLSFGVIETHVPGVRYLRSLGKCGLPRSFSEGIYNGNSSGFCAIQVALLLGADPIYLLGFDMCAVNGRIHHYDTTPRPRQIIKYERNMKPHYFRLSMMLPVGRIVVVERAGIESALTCFPRITEEELWR